MAPALSDVMAYLGGQTFGSVTLPDVDLSGKTFIVTGANTGLGLQAVKHLSALGAAHVILGCRSEEKARTALTTISTDLGTELTIWTVDLSSYQSILAFAERITKVHQGC